MGSSGSNNTRASTPWQPPAGANVAPEGQSTRVTPKYWNFLGETNAPMTGLTPKMFAAINAEQQAVQPPGPGMHVTSAEQAQGLPGVSITNPLPTTAAPAAIDPNAKREALAKALAERQAISGLAPNNRPGGRRPYDPKTGTYSNNPDWDRTRYGQPTGANAR